MSSDSPTPLDLNYYVRLFLLPNGGDFFLNIPIATITRLCRHPLKYLCYLGWCILGVEGGIALQPGGDPIDLEGDLDDETEMYYYVTDSDLDQGLTTAVDLEVIKLRTNVPSETTDTRDKFHEELVERDVCCVFSGAMGAKGMHIIPFERGTEWLQLILDNRPRYDENVTSFSGINDIRNGVLALSSIHDLFDIRTVAILKTPNHVLKTSDIPPRTDRRLRGGITYPPKSRYTLQWLTDPDEFNPAVCDGSDAAFKHRTRKAKPSDLLLHYNYGAAALKLWGRGTETFNQYISPLRPTAPAPAPLGPPKTRHERGQTIRKLNEARGPGEPEVGPSRHEAATDNPEDKVMWDEDDVMLFFWGNSPAAIERHLKRANEKRRKIEDWREGALQVLAYLAMR